MTMQAGLISTCGVDAVIGELLARLEVARDGGAVLAEIEAALDRGVAFVNTRGGTGGRREFTASPVLRALLTAARAGHCTAEFACRLLNDPALQPVSEAQR